MGIRCKLPTIATHWNEQEKKKRNEMRLNCANIFNGCHYFYLFIAFKTNKIAFIGHEMSIKLQRILLLLDELFMILIGI